MELLLGSFLTIGSCDLEQNDKYIKLCREISLIIVPDVKLT